MGSAGPVRIRGSEWFIFALASAALVGLKTGLAWSADWMEVFGFITGGACVWLGVRRHQATWPIGLANNVAYFIVFFEGRLYADMSLQIAYFVLGVYGWLNWRWGTHQTHGLLVPATPLREWLITAMAVPAATALMYQILLKSNDAAPFLDALTTALSLAAQWSMSRRRPENWLLWIAVDLIYVPLYWSRDLHLTAVLYAVFLGMCCVGWWQWRRAAVGQASRP